MKKQTGFTIVELLIVIVVIGILATITIVAFNGIQNRARQLKIDSDMRNLKTAINIARVNNGSSTYGVTSSYATGSQCWGKPTGTDLATLASTDGCWAAYNAALDKISTVSATNVRGLVDPWGRPYYMDENEGEGGNCGQDAIGVYALPFTTGQTMTKHTLLSKVTPVCT